MPQIRYARTNPRVTSQYILEIGAPTKINSKHLTVFMLREIVFIIRTGLQRLDEYTFRQIPFFAIHVRLKFRGHIDNNKWGRRYPDMPPGFVSRAIIGKYFRLTNDGLNKIVSALLSCIPDTGYQHRLKACEHRYKRLFVHPPSRQPQENHTSISVEHFH